MEVTAVQQMRLEDFHWAIFVDAKQFPVRLTDFRLAITPPIPRHVTLILSNFLQKHKFSDSQQYIVRNDAKTDFEMQMTKISQRLLKIQRGKPGPAFTDSKFRVRITSGTNRVTTYNLLANYLARYPQQSSLGKRSQ